MIRRARLLSVVVTVLCGALGVISSTQTWLTVELQDAAHHILDVPGASAVPVLAPLSLAVLALGAALSIVGVALQGLLRNPLAEPFVLGVSGGAAVGATFAILAGLSGLTVLGASLVPLAALVGGLAATALVHLFAAAARG